MIIRRQLQPFPPKGKDLGLIDGERATAARLAKEPSSRLFVSDHVGVREIEMLITNLQIDRRFWATKPKRRHRTNRVKGPDGLLYRSRA
jgi:hypothetical protein